MSQSFLTSNWCPVVDPSLYIIFPSFQAEQHQGLLTVGRAQWSTLVLLVVLVACNTHYLIITSLATSYNLVGSSHWKSWYSGWWPTRLTAGHHSGLDHSNLFLLRLWCCGVSQEWLPTLAVNNYWEMKLQVVTNTSGQKTFNHTRWNSPRIEMWAATITIDTSGNTC